MAQFRCGILPLKIETGRYYNIPADLRLCEICSENCIEDEIHFLFFCKTYKDIRDRLFLNVNSLIPNFLSLGTEGKLNILMNTQNGVKHCARFISEAMVIRSNLLHNNVSWRTNE